MKIDPKSRFHWENMWECKLMWLDETWNVITQQGIQHIRGNVKIILFPEIIVLKNKWLLNSSKNIIKELVSRKRLLLFIRLQAQSMVAFHKYPLLFLWLCSGKRKRKILKSFYLSCSLFLTLHKGIFKEVVWRVNGMLIYRFFCLLAICFHPKVLTLRNKQTKQEERSLEIRLSSNKTYSKGRDKSIRKQN